MKITHFLGFHNPLDCIETGEIKYEFQSPFDLFITQWKQYQCKCGRKFWYPPGSFEQWKMEEFIFKLRMDTAKELEKAGRIDEAIEVLKL